MANITITLNQQEASALLELINLAVKSAGLQAAEAGVVLSRKITDAAQEIKPEVAETAE